MSIISLPGFIFICILLTSCGSSKKNVRVSGEDLGNSGTQKVLSPATRADTVLVTTKYDPIQVKYGKYLRVEPEIIRNAPLYYFIDKWLHTPYKWGGMDANGIDCSAFLQRLLAEVYTIQIPRTSVEQFFAQRVEKFKSAEYLSEGDLVFFRTMENKIISHVGLYLHNDMFVNSSSSKGVSIASLKDPYWKKRFVAAGRLRVAAVAK
jgi:lipoprotein Spr